MAEQVSYVCLCCVCVVFVIFCVCVVFVIFIFCVYFVCVCVLSLIHI